MLNSPAITIIYDGLCPYCVAQAGALRRLDRDRGKIACVDFTASGFDAAKYGLKPEDATTQMHGVLPDGTIVRGMETIRRAFSATGWGWVAAPTGWPGLKWIFDRGYAWFARHRRRLWWRTRDCAGGRCEG